MAHALRLLVAEFPLRDINPEHILGVTIIDNLEAEAVSGGARRSLLVWEMARQHAAPRRMLIISAFAALSSV